MADEIYSLGEWIRRRRKTLDMTQQGLADRAHCSIDTIKKIETDTRRPSRQLASLIAEQLELPEEQRDLFIDIARGLRPLKALLEKTPQTPESRLVYDSQPVSTYQIIGRESELAALKLLIQDSRVVTITGPGGVGKSSLAQAFISASQKQRVKMIFISLVGVNAVDHIQFSIASALGLDIPFDADPLSQILAYLSYKKMILVFDNFEHLLKGTQVLGQILQSAPGVRLLVTSRERLRIPDEQNYPLQGLRYPKDDNFTGSISEYPAPELFVNCARKITPDFSIEDHKSIIDICRFTEGLPLALEMLASWTDVLPIKDILPELRRNLDLLAHEHPKEDVRHRSMRTVFEASWRMLNKTEREVFARMCVFRNGLTRQAAESVAGASLGVLSILVSRSMIKMDLVNGRYSVHGLLQLFGEEYLKSLGALEKVQLEHARYFLLQAETTLTYLHGPQQQEMFDILDTEQDNVRLALTSLFSLPGKEEHAAQMVLALCWYWRIRSRVVEARKWLEKALQSQPTSIEVQAALHFHAGHFGWMQSDTVFARSNQQTSLMLWQSLDDIGAPGAAYCYCSLGMVADQENNFTEAVRNLEISIRMFEELEDSWGMAFARHRLGGTLLALEDLDAAGIHLKESQQYFRSCGDRWALGLVVGILAKLEFLRNNLKSAITFAEEAIEIRRELGHLHSVIDSTSLIAEIALKQDDRRSARRLYQSALKLSDEIGNQQYIVEFKNRLNDLDA